MKIPFIPKIKIVQVFTLAGILILHGILLTAGNNIEKQLIRDSISSGHEEIDITSTHLYEKGKLLPATTETTSAVFPIDKMIKQAGTTQEACSEYQRKLFGTLPTAIAQQTFEEAFPDSLWSVYASLGSVDAYWGVVNSIAYEGTQSAWCGVNGTGSISASSGAYLNNMDSWMIYGPFSLTDATSGALSFYLNSNTESGYDYFKYMVSTDGINFKGWQVSGETSGWINKTIDFTDVPVLGNICGSSQVYVAFNFNSDGNSSNFSGSYIDSITIEKTAGPKPDMELSESSLSAILAINQTLSQNLTINNNGTTSLNWQLTESYPVLGSWNFSFDWSCDGSAATTNIVFFTDGTFETATSSGTWTITGKQVEWTYPSGTQYSGTLSGDTMTGQIIYEDNDLGCWSAYKSSNTSQLSWLTFEPLTDSLNAGNTQRVTIGYHSTGLTTGVYYNSLFLATNDPAHSMVIIPVTMTVSTCSIPGTPIVNIIDQPTCSRTKGSVLLSNLPGSGEWALTLNPTDSIITGKGNPATIDSISPGSYTFTVTNASGCSSNPTTEFIILPQPEIPTAPIVSTINQPTCNSESGSVVLTDLPDDGFWLLNGYPDLSMIIGTGRDTLVEGLLKGSYTFTVTNLSGCTSELSKTVVIHSQPITPKAPIMGTVVIPTCEVLTGSIELKGLPSTGIWLISGTPDSITVSGTGTDTILYGLNPATYQFWVTNESGCISVASSEMVLEEGPEIPIPPTIDSIVQPTCFSDGNRIVITDLPSTGTWILTRIPGDTTITGTGETITLTNQPAGIYTYNVTNEDGCRSKVSDYVVINQQPLTPTAPMVEEVIQPTSSLPTGSVILNELPSEGLWTLTRIPDGILTYGTGTDATLSLLPAGAYQYTVTNESGCISSASDTIVVKEYVGNSIAEFGNSLLLYPNPVTDELIIEKTGNRKTLGYKIMDTSGRIVSSGKITGQTIIRTSTFAKGVYLIQLNDTESVVPVKFIKE